MEFLAEKLNIDADDIAALILMAVALIVALVR